MGNLNELIAFAQSHPGLALTVALWALIWKGLGLWHSASARQRGWFIAILLINSFGLLEIIYLFGIAKKPASELFRW